MEGTGVNAKVYINGKYCLLAIDGGDGGEMYFQNAFAANEDTVEGKLVAELEAYIETLQPKKMMINSKEISIKQDLAGFIDDLLLEWEENQNRKKYQRLINKHSKTSIVFGDPKSYTFKYLNFNRPLSMLNKDILTMHLRDVQKKHCKDGVVILNTNLKQYGITI